MAKVIKRKQIPKTVKQVIRSQKKRKKLPSSYFLMPKERKFPYKDPKTGKIRCDLLKAAIVRAAQHNYPTVEQKARRLYQKHCKGGK